jgi:hypothetical protein
METILAIFWLCAAAYHLRDRDDVAFYGCLILATVWIAA